MEQWSEMERLEALNSENGEEIQEWGCSAGLAGWGGKALILKEVSCEQGFSRGEKMAR